MILINVRKYRWGVDHTWKRCESNIQTQYYVWMALPAKIREAHLNK